MRLFKGLVIWGVGLAVALPAARADEGMWTYNNFPTAHVEKKYGFTPTAGWLDHLRLSSVRFNNGGSGSFVSPDGLVLTNHHVGADCIQKISSAGHDYYKGGFSSKEYGKEAPCPDLELNVLETISDVTPRVNAAVTAGMTDSQASDARRKTIAEIEKDATAQSGLRSDVVTLYQGEEYDLYQYKKFTDVRLVFSPEFQTAFFGGDPDNFEYPRYDIDFAFFRVYENGKPYHPKDHLKWSDHGPGDHELVFVSGNPGRTSRLDTVSQLEVLRDTVYPKILGWLERWRGELLKYGAGGAEQERESHETVFGIENSLKALRGYLGALQDKDLMNSKTAAEVSLRSKVDANPEWKSKWGGAWDAISRADQEQASLFDRSMAFRPLAAQSHLFNIAQTLLQREEETTKPNGIRYQEFRDSALASLDQRLFSPAPIYPALEEASLTDALANLKATLGAGDPLVKALFAGGESPAEMARRLVEGTKLADVAFRKKLEDGGINAVMASDDPMLVFAKAIDPAARALRDKLDRDVNAVTEENGPRVADAYFAVNGKNTYPDATFTLRLSYGEVMGYQENGKWMPFQTDFAGLFRHSEEHGGKPPYDLSPRMREAHHRLNLKAPVDFVSTCDIIGGNSGSPVVDQKGRLVGLIFDGDIQMLGLNFAYTDKQARAIAVDTDALTAALSRIYQGQYVLRELEEGSK